MSDETVSVQAGVCTRCGSGVLLSGEHIRDDLPPCFGEVARIYPESTRLRFRHHEQKEEHEWDHKCP